MINTACRSTSLSSMGTVDSCNLCPYRYPWCSPQQIQCMENHKTTGSVCPNVSCSPVQWLLGPHSQANLSSYVQFLRRNRRTCSTAHQGLESGPTSAFSTFSASASREIRVKMDMSPGLSKREKKTGA
jgi:hypothetical protein